MKTFVDDEGYNSSHGHAYETYGVDPEKGAVVLVRPDQCKSSPTGSTDHVMLTTTRRGKDHLSRRRRVHLDLFRQIFDSSAIG